MTSVQELLVRSPDIVNSLGEEIWLGLGTNMALIRLKPGTSSEKRRYPNTKEWYGVLSGRPTLFIDGELIQLSRYKLVTIGPGQLHQLVNNTTEDVLFAVLTRIPWNEKDSYVF